MLNAVRRWLRAAYAWTLHWSESPQALTALLLIALVESSVFPIPPDVLLIAIVAARPQAWLRAAAACTAGSAIGAALGYAIGAGFMATLGQPIVDFYGAQDHWDRVVGLYNGEWGVWFLAVAAFTPIPFKVATISAGATQMAFVPFVVVSLFGRAARFCLSQPSFAYSEPKSAVSLSGISTWLRYCFSSSSSAAFSSCDSSSEVCSPEATLP